MAEDETANEVAASHVIYLSGKRSPGSRRTLPHQRAHVLQHDFVFFAWSDPVEEWAARSAGVSRFAYRYLDFNLAVPAVWGGLRELTGLAPNDDPLEIEAEFLERRR